jgi:hypothetical protein
MSTPQLALGKLLRVRGMVIAAAQVEATHFAAGALARAYVGMRGELLAALQPNSLSELRDEFERLFEPLEIPEPFNRFVGNAEQLAQVAVEAQLSLRRLEGWIQGLIDELTLDQKMRMEAEETAKLASKIKPGFQT